MILTSSKAVKSTMLIQFSVGNFLSFDDDQTFSMLASSTDKSHTTHLLPCREKAVLRAAAIYGPNASGKSNLIQSMSYAQRLIVEGIRGNKSLGVRQFRMRQSSEDRPTYFEFVVCILERTYNYGFRMDSKQITEEWLYATAEKQEVCLFERTTNKDGSVSVLPGPRLKGRGKTKEQFLEFIAKGMQRNQLFLTEASQRNVKELKTLFDWFQDSLLIVPAEPRANKLEMAAHNNNTFSLFMSNFLKAADTGITRIETDEVSLDIDAFLADIPTEIQGDIRQSLEAIEDNEILNMKKLDGKQYFVMRSKSGDYSHIRMRMQHQADDNNIVSFNIDEESDGTQRLLHLLPALFMLKTDSDKTFIVDELDRRFHTHLSRMFLQTALDCESSSRSQIIFSTHDTNLLDLYLLRRDEIWFVEKDKMGASHLYSLAEFNVRPDLKIEKGYLNGRFGAIPFISNLKELGWTSTDTSSEHSSHSENHE